MGVHDRRLAAAATALPEARPEVPDQIIDAVMAQAIQTDTARAHPLFAWIVMRDLPEYPGEFDAWLAFPREGDVLIVTKPDRLARSVGHLLQIVADIEKRGIGLVILSMGGERVDTRIPTSQLILTILAGVSAWEREIVWERQAIGVAAAKAAGKYLGRPRSYDPERIRKMAADGMTARQISRDTAMHRGGIYRAIAAGKPKSELVAEAA